MSWPLWFIDVEGTDQLSYAQYDLLIDQIVAARERPTANIQRLEGRLRKRFSGPRAWAFEASGRVLSASFSYQTVDADVLLAEARAACAAIFDPEHLMIFPPFDSWPDLIEP